MGARDHSARVAGLVLAAGSGRRFGSPKQLAALHGRPLLEHALLAMAGAACLDEVVVVLRTVVTADRPAVDDEAQAATSAPLIATRASDRSTRNGPITGSI